MFHIWCPLARLLCHAGHSLPERWPLCVFISISSPWKLPELNTRRSANVAGSLQVGCIAVSRTEALSSDVCNILFYVQLYFSCFRNVKAEITNLFYNGNNMLQSTCRASQPSMRTTGTKMAFRSAVFIHNCGAFGEFIVPCEQTSCHQS